MVSERVQEWGADAKWAEYDLPSRLYSAYLLTVEQNEVKNMS